jgi:hypothetical protein
MPWADFWEMLDGRLWWEMRKQGVKETPEVTPRQAEETKTWARDLAAKYLAKPG